jgi:hypothetical protein
MRATTKLRNVAENYRANLCDHRLELKKVYSAALVLLMQTRVQCRNLC